MLRYSTLLQQGMIKAPVITQQQQTVTGDKTASCWAIKRNV
nr:type IV secretory system conjugative DNA transfer family protein [Klebsiella pneumoniae]